MGRPTTYNGYTATWTRGKLSKLTKGSIRTGTETYNYTYNAFGQRIGINYNYMAGTSSSSAIVMGMLTSYSQTFKYDQSGRLISEKKTSQYYGEGSVTEKIVYLYDECGIIGMVLEGSAAAGTYYFQRNLLGDVIGIYDTRGKKVAGYAYDAWGKCTITSDTEIYDVAHANPIRYRGYYYDEDTKLYYLNARYYSPEWRRFISLDDTAYLDPETPNGLNLYCYCNNDPVNYADPSGNSPEWWQWLISGTTTTLGIALCFIPGMQVLGAGLIVGGAMSLTSNILSAAGVDSRTACIITNISNIVVGSFLCFTPLAAIGASMIGSGILGMAGGYISEALGGSFELGSAIGNIIGGIFGGLIYRGLVNRGIVPFKTSVKRIVENPLDDINNPQIGPKPGEIARKIQQIGLTGKYNPLEVIKLQNGTYQVQNGHHRLRALLSLNYKYVWVKITK